MSREQITFFRHALHAGLWLMKIDGPGRYRRIRLIADSADGYQWRAWTDLDRSDYIDLFHTSPTAVLVFAPPTSTNGVGA